MTGPVHVLILAGQSDRPTVPPGPASDPLDDEMLSFIRERVLEEPDRVLVVDDDHAIADGLRDVLMAETHPDGSPLYDVAIANDGDDALACVRAHRPACILLDVMLPGVDGLAVYNFLKSTERYRDIPILFITAMAHVLREPPDPGHVYVTDPTKAAKVAARKAVRAGSVPPPAGIISKPFDLDDLLRKVRGAVASTKGKSHG